MTDLAFTAKIIPLLLAGWLSVTGIPSTILQDNMTVKNDNEVYVVTEHKRSFGTQNIIIVIPKDQTQKDNTLFIINKQNGMSTELPAKEDPPEYITPNERAVVNKWKQTLFETPASYGEAIKDIEKKAK